MNDEPTLTAVPDVGDPELQSEEEFLAEGEGEVTDEQVDELFTALEEQNQQLLGQLQLLGKAVNPLMLLKLQIDVLIDFTFPEGSARKQYETACSLRLNEMLKMTLAQVIGARIEK